MQTLAESKYAFFHLLPSRQKQVASLKMFAILLTVSLFSAQNDSFLSLGQTTFKSNIYTDCAAPLSSSNSLESMYISTVKMLDSNVSLTLGRHFIFPGKHARGFTKMPRNLQLGRKKTLSSFP